MPEKKSWDERYAAPEFLFGTEPNRYLQSQVWRLQRGMTALSVGDGEGRNGVWLVEQGLDVLSVDLSEVGLKKAAELANKRGVVLRTLCCDLLKWDWPVNEFDLITSIFVHFPSAVRKVVYGKMTGALKSGGLLVLEGYHTRQLGRTNGGPKDADMLSTKTSLREEFATLTPIEILDGVALLDHGAVHGGESDVVRLLARKP